MRRHLFGDTAASFLRFLRLRSPSSRFSTVFAFLCSLLLSTCTPLLCLGAPVLPGPNAVHVTLLHLNDCYELLPARGTDLGGVARVATLRKQLLRANPNTYTLLAGDLFAPSALGSTPIPFPNGPAYAGAQMVAGMNSLGVDLACLGNHETDVPRSVFMSNLALSNFTWLSANARVPYTNLAPYAMLRVPPPASAPQGQEVKLGVFGLTIDSNNRPWADAGQTVAYEYFYNFSASAGPVAQQAVNDLKAQGAHVLVALTHWDASSDVVLTQKVAGISIVVGGHEHSVVKIDGPSIPAPIYKADSNVRSVWVHELYIDPTVARNNPAYFIHHSRLVVIDSRFEDDPATAAAVAPFVAAAFRSYEDAGFNVSDPVALLTRPLDLRMSTLGSGIEQNVSKWFAEAVWESGKIQAEFNGSSVLPELAIVNIGCLRIDDVIPSGTLLDEYEIMSIEPFLNSVQVASVRGTTLQRVLDAGWAQRYGLNNNMYASQFLAWSNVSLVAEGTSPSGEATGFPVNTWAINSLPLDPGRLYLTAVTDYMLGLDSGGHPTGPTPFEDLSPHSNPAEVKVVLPSVPGDWRADPRIFFIQRLRAEFPLQPQPTPIPGDMDGAASTRSMGIASVLLAAAAVMALQLASL